VRARPEPDPPHLGRGKRRLVFLIHGFNTSRDGARESYARFVGLVQRLGRAAQPILDDCVGFFWPGDAKLGPISFISYPTEIRPAITAAARLRDYLQTVTGPEGSPVEIVLIAHSLGNRVALELLQLLSAAPLANVQVTRLCLMAAAVPVSHVRDGQRLNAGARLARTRALYSGGDGVLTWAFPIGQTAAGDGFMPEAIGHRGHPVSVWGSGQPMGISQTEAYDHNDYWVSEPTAWEVAHFLGAPVGAPPARNYVSSHGLRARGAIGALPRLSHDLPGVRLFG
jgi:hypothetical protein